MTRADKHKDWKSALYVYVIHDLETGRYMAKSADALGNVSIIYVERLHAFQFAPDDVAHAQQELVREQARGRVVTLEQVDLC